ncbi:MAG: TIGR01777 family oxidoreductase [Saprospiraceae bacterium]
MADTKEIIWIAGGDGLVGRRLMEMIDCSKYQIFILSRSVKKSPIPEVNYIVWNTTAQTINTSVSPDHIINLAGAGIADQRWTNSRKKELVDSRVNSAKTIKRYITETQVKPKTYVSSSAVGYYGDRGSEILSESSPPGNEFLAECCVQWEAAAKATGIMAARSVILRIGIVLSTKGGALPKMLMSKSFGVFNYFGLGDQYHPWIHIDDLCRLFITTITDPTYTGIYNAVSPQQITNRQMMAKIMAHNQLKGILLPAPKLALQMVLGDMSKVVLNSNRIGSSRLQEEGFIFEHTDVGQAVQNLLAKKI